MARPRKPTALLTPDAFRRNPKRARPAEPQPTGPLGDPPARLSAAEKTAWRELSSQIPANVLTNTDRAWLEIASRLWARMVKDGIGGGGLMVGEVAALKDCLSKMGMNPSDRSKISVRRDSEQTNPFAELGGKNSGLAPRLN